MLGGGREGWWVLLKRFCWTLKGEWEGTSKSPEGRHFRQQVQREGGQGPRRSVDHRPVGRPAWEHGLGRVGLAVVDVSASSFSKKYFY